jgi:two-component system, OmpR family, alkaline phosphatase synthesis response regulator PhoP
MSKILIVDDEEDIRVLVRFHLEKEGHEIEEAQNGREAVAKAKEFRPDLILMDLMMPEMDGMEATYNIREIPQLKTTIIAFLSARNEDYTQIAGFNAGADDYIAKPIKPHLLTSRINALLRRSSMPIEASNVDVVGDITLDREKYIVLKGDQRITLPKKEFELFALLVSKPGHVFTRDNILNSVWGNDVIVGDRTIDVHIRKLREKIGDEYIKTVKGVGYKLNIE